MTTSWKPISQILKLVVLEIDRKRKGRHLAAGAPLNPIDAQGGSCAMGKKSRLPLALKTVPVKLGEEVLVAPLANDPEPLVAVGLAEKLR